MKIGVYAGSFNPFHLGHYDVLVQSEQLFDKVIIAVGNNTEKNYQQRTEIPSVISNHTEVIHYSKLLPELITDLRLVNTENTYTLVRGLRNGHDLEYERNQLAFMKGISSSLQVVFFVCNPIHEHISSSSLRALKQFSQFEYEKYIVK